MSDLFDYAEETATPAAQHAVLSVSELSQALRLTVEECFSYVAVEGEISGLKIAASGHHYFQLKDEKNVLKAIIWRSQAAAMDTRIEEGMQVIAYGMVTTYGARSEYQIVIRKLEPAGLGALMQRFEALKASLAAEGLFEESRKQLIPYLPRKIGVVTSPTGAVIQDMLHRISDRCPTHVQVWPVLVQGSGAKEQIAAAIDGFNALPKTQQPDVLIVARGGGSLEDLWAFNEEIVVRAVAASTIPVISGVGHEPDVTLCDYAADLRAPTPSAAAEMAVPKRDDLLYTLSLHHSKLAQGVRHKVAALRQHVTLLGRALPRPESQLNQAQLKLDDWHGRLNNALNVHVSRLAERLDARRKLLASYSPRGPLSRGYAYVTDAQGGVVRSAQHAVQYVTLHFHDGERKATLDTEK